MPSEDEGRDQGEASTSQGTPKIAANHQKPGERPGTDSLSQPPEGANLVHTFTSDLQPPQLWDNKCLSFQPPSLWYFVRQPFWNSSLIGAGVAVVQWMLDELAELPRVSTGPVTGLRLAGNSPHPALQLEANCSCQWDMASGQERGTRNSLRTAGCHGSLMAASISGRPPPVSLVATQREQEKKGRKLAARKEAPSSRSGASSAL